MPYINERAPQRATCERGGVLTNTNLFYYCTGFEDGLRTKPTTNTAVLVVQHDVFYLTCARCHARYAVLQVRFLLFLWCRQGTVITLRFCQLLTRNRERSVCCRYRFVERLPCNPVQPRQRRKRVPPAGYINGKTGRDDQKRYTLSFCDDIRYALKASLQKCSTKDTSCGVLSILS